MTLDERERITEIRAMQPLQIVEKTLIRHGDVWRLAADDRPATATGWPGTFIYVPGPLKEVRRRVDAVRTFVTAVLFPAEGGAWVRAEASDLRRIAEALGQAG